MLWWTVRQLKSKNWSKRLQAVEKLGDSANPQVIGSLVSALKDQDNEVRKAAVEALGKIGTPQGFPYVLNALADSEYSVRVAAAAVLGRSGNAEALGPLKASLKDKDSLVRKTAADVLERHWRTESEQALEEYRRVEEEAKRLAEEEAKRLAEETRAKRLAAEAKAKDLADKLIQERSRMRKECVSILRACSTADQVSDGLIKVSNILKNIPGEEKTAQVVGLAARLYWVEPSQTRVLYETKELIIKNFS